ncbi:hypothetical protein NEOLEDRAFT_638864 [Neolentinus lepideus HHB14362 ss-1]|uniref:Uncharacterized protein n=1 Tax=Neolentinus lepideus HHB14362 ss-1 TaxID=1314782 RepID=A0A165QP25_9AGAM|nr:hypothetical protein NEOLEDRAFT_638864 [Neolentinus lepideus HHB14362 ss-1]
MVGLTSQRSRTDSGGPSCRFFRLHLRYTYSEGMIQTFILGGDLSFFAGQLQHLQSHPHQLGSSWSCICPVLSRSRLLGRLLGTELVVHFFCLARTCYLISHMPSFSSWSNTSCARKTFLLSREFTSKKERVSKTGITTPIPLTLDELLRANVWITTQYLNGLMVLAHKDGYIISVAKYCISVVPAIHIIESLNEQLRNPELTTVY